VCQCLLRPKQTFSGAECSEGRLSALPVAAPRHAALGDNAVEGLGADISGYDEGRCPMQKIGTVNRPLLGLHPQYEPADLRSAAPRWTTVSGNFLAAEK
jgi:hypothetical protein